MLMDNMLIGWIRIVYQRHGAKSSAPHNPQPTIFLETRFTFPSAQGWSISPHDRNEVVATANHSCFPHVISVPCERRAAGESCPRATKLVAHNPIRS